MMGNPRSTNFMTNPLAPSVLLICADSGLTRRYIAELASAGGPHQTPLATSLAQARNLLIESTPCVILLDESGLGPNGGAAPIEITAGELTKFAPVVVAAAAHHHESLAFLVSSGAVDLVVRTGNFAPVTAGLVARRARLGVRAFTISSKGGELERDFGELLRHEVNNPLTGILGNAELLLKRRDWLPPQAVARLETIAELAVRLRETIRRLSDSWESGRGSAPLV
jgi:signal transduction histidine kinase